MENNKFENFILNIPNVTNENELCDLICTLGLFHDNRNIYENYNMYQLANNAGGLWQNPLELSTFLWNIKDIFINANVSSFLEIGTFTGYTFFVVNEFLKAHVCPTLISKTIDPNNFIRSDILPYICEYIQTGTIDDIIQNKEQYDFVFIDGLHENPGPTHDFISIESFAKFACFHDVVDRYCPDVVAAFKEYSAKYPSKIFSLSTVQCFGIGLLQLQ